MRLISIFTFLMSSMVMYRSNSDHNVVCRDIWFRIKRNLGPFWSLLGPFWQVLRSLKLLIFVNILVAALDLCARRHLRWVRVAVSVDSVALASRARPVIVGSNWYKAAFRPRLSTFQTLVLTQWTNLNRLLPISAVLSIVVRHGTLWAVLPQ